MNRKHLFSRRRRSKVGFAPSGNMHFTHAAFSGSAHACRPVCARVLLPPRGLHRHRQTVSRKSAVCPPVEREGAAAGVDSLYKTQLVKQRGRQKVHAAGMDGLQDMFGSITQSHRSLLLFQPKGGIPPLPLIYCSHAVFVVTCQN